jgi:6-pyruvoyl-tetrahydropterin synthase
MARLFVDNLTVIDFSYLDTVRGVVGESWMVDVELVGELDHQGMIFDFGYVKKKIKRYIDNEIDHCLLVPINVSGCSCKYIESSVLIDFPLSSGGFISHYSPQNAVMLVNSGAINKEYIANELQVGIKDLLPKNIKSIQIQLRSEATDDAYYHYTHGLQKHSGQCQRIAHGHRSCIEIIINGERNASLETEWASRLQDSYIATLDHVREEFEINDVLHTHLLYTALEGNFSISLPSSKVIIMPVESTVENIATYLAKLVAEENKADVVVKAYEGVGKGAYGYAIAH